MRDRMAAVRGTVLRSICIIQAGLDVQEQAEAVDRVAARDLSLAVDRSVPLVIAKVGRYPLHHGTVAAVRSLGRLGVPVYAVTEGPLVPTAVSRYLTGRIAWPTTGGEQAEELVAGLVRVGERVGRRSVLLVTDDRAAVLVAEHRQALTDLFAVPAIDGTLVGRLADKQGLHELCREHGVPTPKTRFARSAAQLRNAVRALGLPVVIKNAQVWGPAERAAVKYTTVLRTEADAEALAAGLAAPDGGGVLVQEYIPHDPRVDGEPPDWFTHFYCDGQGEPRVMFTGVKLRSWPPAAGITARGVSVAHPRLAAAAAELCRSIGYRGIGDLDWRFDQRDGLFKLVDFNPRVGAQFQLFRTTSGVDVVRALHLDMSRRPIPPGRQVDAREFVVEHLDAGAALAERLGGRSSARPAMRSHRRSGIVPAACRRVPAWFAWDDPLPFAAATAQFATGAVRLGWRSLTRRLAERVRGAAEH